MEEILKVFNNVDRDNILGLIEDKIREAENCEDEDITEEYLKGYKNGLEIAKIIVVEFMGGEI